jgi:hypothetical protein
MSYPYHLVAKITSVDNTGKVQAQVLFKESIFVEPSKDSIIECAVPEGLPSQPQIDQIWLILVSHGPSFALSQSLTKYNVVYVDATGRVTMIYKGNAPWDSQALGGEWKSYRSPPTCKTGVAGMEYFPYLQTPTGFYKCAVLPLDLDIPFGIDMLTQIVPAADIPASPSVIHLGGIEFVAVKFQYSTTDAVSRAVQMYRPVAPEYPSRNYCVVAYPASVVQPQETIYVSLKTTNYDFALKVVHLRAIVKGKLEAYLIGCTPFNFWANSRQSILFSSFGGEDGYIPFSIDLSHLLPITNEVGEYINKWQWQYCLGDPAPKSQKWYDIEEMTVRIYCTLDYPSAPWGGTQNRPLMPTANSAPLVGLLVNACRYAAGATTELQAASLITTEMINCSTYIYDTAPRYTTYAAYTSANIPETNSQLKINVISLMETLTGMMGSPLTVNCVDLSRTLLLLANSIGCKLQVAMLTNVVPTTGFDLQPHIPVGTHAVITTGHFNFHQIAYWVNPDDESPWIFDPCLCLVDENGTTTPVLGIPYNDYVSKLVTKEFQDSIVMTDLRDELMMIV